VRALTAVIAVGLLAALAPGTALAKKTADLTFKSTGKAAAPGVAAPGTDGTFEDFPFTIAADDADGQVAVEVHWTNPADDFDLVVYKKNSSGGLDQVGSSGSAPPSDTESTTISQQGTDPVPPGDYVVRVNNYAATNPDFEGSVKFTEFTGPPNQRPVAKLKAPKKAKAGKAIKLDASGSSDPDGHVVSYAWDLDGDGSIETDGGSSPTLKHAFAVGVYHPSVRVTDDKGRRAYATLTIRVTKAKPKKKRK
jgi:hypothetical protein